MTSGNSGTAQPPLLPVPVGTHYVGPHQGDEPIEVTVVLRRRRGAPIAATWPQPPAVTHSQAHQSNPDNRVRRYVYLKGPDHGGCGRLTVVAEPVERLLVGAVLTLLDSPHLIKVLAGTSVTGPRELVHAVCTRVVGPPI